MSLLPTESGGDGGAQRTIDIISVFNNTLTEEALIKT